MGTIVIDEQFDKCRRMLKDDISRKRYIHSLGVSDTAACLAMRYGFDIRIAALAGLLHDCAKGLDDKEMLATARKGGLEISEIELANPELLHSKAGSVLAKEKYGIEDEDILGSICWHTTGRPGMSMLEKIIFLADYIEPNRANIPWINDIRQKAFTDIDEAVALACKNSIDYLQRSSRTVDRITIDTYEYYKDHLK
ncbi:MAG: bis(5'-nucleosyl)-tetraphosphatase (symmetrical) YqeK [Lachnospiraceae bacterium]|nr:bis(5'-nucleosyl)-tetraphosphatase (symmetrical) YqeK [Lachnospiraceae bacterium]